MPKSALINSLATPHLEAFVWVDMRDLVGNKVASRLSSVELPMPLYCQHFACCAAAQNNSRAGLSVLLRCARLPDIASLLYGLTHFPPPTFPGHEAGHYIQQVFVQRLISLTTVNILHFPFKAHLVEFYIYGNCCHYWF